MKNILFLFVLFGIIIGASKPVFAVSPYITLDGNTNGDKLDYTVGYSEYFGAGTYNFSVDDGVISLWNSAENTWAWGATIFNPESTNEYTLGDLTQYETPTIAFNAHSSDSVTVVHPGGDLWFYIKDHGDDNSGTLTMAVNTISVAPEPVSSALFIVGGLTLGFRRFYSNRKAT